MSDPRLQRSAAQENRAYYERHDAGRDDYWNKMAAPRFRMTTLVGELVRSRPATLIDLGCGNGAVLREIQRRLPSTTLAGIDLSNTQIQRNRDAFPSVDWRCLNLDGPVDFDDELLGGFEAVTAMEIIEHLDCPESFLRAAWALATPRRGQLYLSTQSGPVRETERRVGHRQHFGVAQMNELLTATGWRPLRIWNAGFPFHDLSKWYANRDPDQSMSRFAEQRYGWRENVICWALRQAFRFNSKRRGAQLFAIAHRPA